MNLSFLTNFCRLLSNLFSINRSCALDSFNHHKSFFYNKDCLLKQSQALYTIFHSNSTITTAFTHFLYHSSHFYKVIILIIFHNYNHYSLCNHLSQPNHSNFHLGELCNSQFRKDTCGGLHIGKISITHSLLDSTANAWNLTHCVPWSLSEYLANVALSSI